MAKIYSLKIRHYRGIENFSQIFGFSNFIVLIGRGDSCKSTILRAISAVLSPNWNVNFTDMDFYKGDTSRPIEIEVDLLNVPTELLDENKYGLYIRLLKGDIIEDDVTDMDTDQTNPLLTIKLLVGDTLEPKWKVTNGRDGIEDKEITATDRAKLNMFMVSDYVDNHFAYSKGSPLYALLRQNLTDKTAIGKKIVEVVRNAHTAVQNAKTFDEFDEKIQNVKDSATQLGLDLSELKTLLEFKENAYTESNISLHDGDIPYRLHGKGSKRLLSIAIQKELTDNGGIVLIDEIEQGLEPDRIVNLTRLLKESKKGQVFVTTHSSYVLVEAKASNLFLMRKGATLMTTFNDELSQKLLRSHPESFFSQKIICCEGKTEQGILRSLNCSLQSTDKGGFSALGIVEANGKGGSNCYTDANFFLSKGFDVCIIADNDVDSLEKFKDYATKKGIPMALCDKGLCIEKQLFKDLPWEAVIELVEHAIKENDNLSIASDLNISEASDLEKVTKEKRAELRIILGDKSVAKKKDWYKDIYGGEFLGSIWLRYLDQLPSECGLLKEYNTLINWIRNGLERFS